MNSNHIKSIHIQDYSYNLPEEKIAKYPLEQRDASKLLVYKDSVIKDRVFTDLANEIPENALLVFNNTKVIHARMLFQRESGAQIEIFCIEPQAHHDYQIAFTQKHQSTWKCLVGNAKRWKGDILTKLIHSPIGTCTLEAHLENRVDDTFTVRFSWNHPEMTFAEVLHYAGILPLPPYLNRETEQNDEERYQTIYAKQQGSVAAPTAGLHFTEKIFESLKQKNINTTEVTLHVGTGTFKPVKSDTLDQHDMHEEVIDISIETLKQIKHALEMNYPVVAVGTTSMRTLESIYWHGVQLIQGKNIVDVHISQWYAYENAETTISTVDSIEAIIHSLTRNSNTSLKGITKILLAPGYQFRITKAIITNFHQPENTLILLIAAFVGKDWRKIYNHALENNYRFLSYGDSSILFAKDL
jgi:S-adenosylmethionine:tRNA ribosyltransferase-isomerase